MREIQLAVRRPEIYLSLSALTIYHPRVGVPIR